MSRDLGDIVDLGDLDPADEARLRRVHALLVAAGPPAELPAGLADPPAAEVVPLASRRRRPTVVVLLAAAVAAACFGTGYLIATGVHGGGAHVVQVVELQGQQNSFASLQVESADANGNWPMHLTVSGLPQLTGRHAHYVLMLWNHGKPAALCGMFRVGKSGAATVTFSVPYAITKSTRFVVTEMVPGAHFPGEVVMTSS